jgi:hypothetical protein
MRDLFLSFMTEYVKTYAQNDQSEGKGNVESDCEMSDVSDADADGILNGDEEDVADFFP